MTHHPDTATIEEHLTRNRTHLSETLEELQGRMSVENLAREALGMIKTNASEYTRSLDNAVRSNPLAIAMTGIGLAWLIFGNRKPAPDPTHRSVDMWENEGGSPAPFNDATFADAPDRDSQWAARIDNLRAVASRALRRIDQDARSNAESMRDYAAERAKVVSAFTEDMRASLADGLEDLSEGARDRILKVRESAYAARLRVASTARNGGSEAGRLVNEHPMIAGVVAMALGAAFAAALPRTRIEDRALGAESARFMARAGELLRQEQVRMSRMAEGVADELKSASRDVADTASKTASEIGENVRARAAAEAKSS